MHIVQVNYNDKTIKEIEDWFCTYYQIRKQRITDAKFLKLLELCWKELIDMNFDNNPDFEDLEMIRSSNFKYYILEYLCDNVFEQDFENKVRGLFNEINRNKRNSLQ